MPKESKALSDVQVRKLTFKRDSNGIPKPDRHPVGGVAGLHLYCKPSGSRSWVLRVKIGDKRKDIGLGSYPSVSLKAARELAREHRISVIIAKCFQKLRQHAPINSPMMLYRSDFGCLGEGEGEVVFPCSGVGVSTKFFRNGLLQDSINVILYPFSCVVLGFPDRLEHCY